MPTVEAIKLRSRRAHSAPYFTLLLDERLIFDPEKNGGRLFSFCCLINVSSALAQALDRLL